MAGLYYQHSGKFSAVGLLLGLIPGILVAFPLAFVYAYLTLYNPFIYINFLATLAFGFLIGAIASAIMHWRKVRNGALASLVGFVVGLVGYYFAWAVWLYAFLRRNDIQDIPLWAITLFPPLLWELMRKVNEVGAWSLRVWVPTGIALWAFWVVEAGTVLVMSTMGAAGGVLADAFCENCNAWCKAEPNVLRVADSDADETKRRLEAKDFAHVEKLGPVAPDAMAWFQFDLDTCSTCPGTNTVSVKAVKVKLEKGKRTEDTSGLVDKLLVTAGDVDTIRRLGQKFALPPPPAAST